MSSAMGTAKSFTRSTGPRSGSDSTRRSMNRSEASAADRQSGSTRPMIPRSRVWTSPSRKSRLESLCLRFPLLMSDSSSGWCRACRQSGYPLIERTRSLGPHSAATIPSAGAHFGNQLWVTWAAWSSHRSRARLLRPLVAPPDPTPDPSRVLCEGPGIVGPLYGRLRGPRCRATTDGATPGPWSQTRADVKRVGPPTGRCHCAPPSGER